MKEVVLAGFANAGKTSLFNLLTSSMQSVGNWSGVTVAVKSKQAEFAGEAVNVTDLPGLSSLGAKSRQGKDITITQQYLTQNSVDLIVNVVDVTQLKRELTLTTQLLAMGKPMVVMLNKTDISAGFSVDVHKLSEALGCPVVAIAANDSKQGDKLKQCLHSHLHEKSVSQSEFASQNMELMERVVKVAEIVQRCTKASESKTSIVQRFDSLALHPVMGLPVFLLMMYLLFMFAINVGSSFIDFFDLVVGHVAVAMPTHYLAQFNLPTWLLTIIEGVGSGVQTVATFIPVVASLFIGLTLLEASGYLARAAFVVEGVMNRVGLPGKAFVPLIVGFGCTVPAVMASRVMDSEAARIKTVMMAPFMSCGARLPVYALFAAAFFPNNGQNLVFLLYLLGIVAAVATGLMLKATLLPSQSGHQLMELPKYQLPNFAYLCKRVYRRTKSFVTGAGKTIVLVVCLLNFINSIGIDGSFGNQDSKNSLLSQGAQVVTPALSPMGIREDNWQAGVGIITGIFAKEVLVATFNSLYSPQQGGAQALPAFGDVWQEAVDSIGANLLGIEPEDPLGIDVGDISDLSAAAAEQQVELSTYHNMQTAFDGQLGAFSYLLFILLYTPCVAAMGAIKNEVGTRWAGFAALWSFTLAYCAATLCYQLGSWARSPVSASITIAIVIGCLMMIYLLLKRVATKRKTIATVVHYS